MSSKSKKDSQKSEKSAAKGEPGVNGLPFEPVSHRKKPPKKSSPPAATAKSASASQAVKAGAVRSNGIPQVVSQRMARRMGFFCGIPTLLGMLTFVASYFIVTNGWFKLPNIAVVLVSMGFFGLGVLGLTYGVLSASWDEERLGTWHGWSDFKTNFAVVRESWRSAKQNSNP